MPGSAIIHFPTRQRLAVNLLYFTSSTAVLYVALTKVDHCLLHENIWKRVYLMLGSPLATLELSAGVAVRKYVKKAAEKRMEENVSGVLNHKMTTRKCAQANKPSRVDEPF